MRRLFFALSLTSLAFFMGSDYLMAGHRGGCGGGCGGGHHHRGHHRGGCGGCGGGHGGCGYGGCGYGGCGMGCGHGGCGYGMGCATCGGCGIGCATCGGYAGIDGAFAPAYAQAESNGQATLVVNLPEDARLTVDGDATTSTSDTRVLVTPPLVEGKVYTYTLRAEVNRDGDVQTVTQTVSFRAGEEKHITLEPATSVASAR